VRRQVGHQAHLHVEPAELGVLRRHPQVAHHGEVDADAEGDAVDGGNEGLGRAEQGVALRRHRRMDAAEVAHDPSHAGVAPRRLDVVARAEALAGAGEDDDPHVVVGLGLGERLDQLLTHVERRRVQAVGTVERDGGDVLVDLVQDLGELHARSSGIWRLSAGSVEMLTTVDYRTLVHDYQADAVDVAEGVRSGALRAVDVVNEALARIERLNPAINAFVHVDAERARQVAADVDRQVAAGADPGPLAGVPLGIKELEWVKGWPATSASTAFKDRVAPATSIMSTRLLAAGAVPVGLTAS